MNKRDIYLTALLILLVGISLGTIFAIYTINPELAPLSDVEITEVKRSAKPFVEDEDLAVYDARFVFKNIAERVTPTVVYIETIVPVDMPEDEFHDFGDNFWDNIMPRRARTVGSGVIISENGYILTNFHVVEGAVRNGLNVVLSNKKEYQAKVVGVDPSTDLAVLKIMASGLPAAIVGNSDTVDVGEWVLAIGNPFRLRSTVTAGIVSALGREVEIINDRMRIESFIQTDAAINKGNSGGALVNTSGQLIGINTAIASQSGNYQGYGFAVPSNLALKVATDIIEFGRVQRAVLGVGIGAVNYERASELGLDEVRGVEILSVSSGDPAQLAGLRAGDVVLEVNGFVVNESNELQEKVAVMRPGDTVTLKVWREGTIISKQIILASYQAPEPEELSFSEEIPDAAEIPEGEGEFSYESDLGFRVRVVETETGNGSSLEISHVFKYSEAWNRGLRSGQKIVSVGGEKVEDIDTLRELITKEIATAGKVMIGINNSANALGFIELQRK